MEILKQNKLMLGQKVSLHKLTSGPYCQVQHPRSSMTMEGSSWCLPGAFSPVFQSLVWEGTLLATETEMWTLPQNL